jgi:hypothetical protein
MNSGHYFSASETLQRSPETHRAEEVLRAHDSAEILSVEALRGIVDF